MTTCAMMPIPSLVELLGYDLDVLLARSLLLPVLLHPGLKCLSGGCVSPAERERRDVGVRDVHLGRSVRRNDADKGIGERRACTTVEEIAYDLRTVFLG